MSDEKAIIKKYVNCDLKRKPKFDKLKEEFLNHDFLFSIRQILFKQYHTPIDSLLWQFYNFLINKKDKRWGAQK